MAEVDHLIATWIKSLFVPYLLVALLVIWLIKRDLKDIRHRWFAFLMHQLTKEKDSKVEEVKKDLFAGLGSITSHDPQLLKENAIKILEIGVGTGVNFSHYPNGSHLVVVEPNPYFIKYYNDNRMKFPNIVSEDILLTTGEKMDEVPDKSVDVVVMTLVLCSVSETEKILQQILRVLVPGGKFYFLEHIREFDTVKYSARQKLQDFLTESGIWPFLFDGCCLNREILGAIKEAGFSKVDSVHFYAPISNFFFKLIKPHLRGIAEK